MSQPGQTSLKIADLIPGVVAALQNRSDVSESNPNPAMRPSSWIKKAIQEITENNVFEELRCIGPAINIAVPTQGNAQSSPLPNYPISQYPIKQFLQPGDDYTITEDPVVFIDYPTNQVGYPMTYETPKAIQVLLNIPGGVPFVYSRYGQNFWFGVQAGQPYTVYLPYQRRHPFVETNLASSPVYLPPSWQDVLEYAGAHRGAIALRWNDQVTFLHNLLYGDPTAARSSGTAIGLIQQRVLQMDRDMAKSTRQIKVRVSRY